MSSVGQIGQIFNDATTNSLKLSIDAAALRQQALAANVANINTPGYHRKDVTAEFQASFQRALEQLNKGKKPDEIQVVAGSIGVSKMQNNPRLDGNTVNLDQEMGEVIKNSTDFDFSAQLLAMKYSGLKAAISGTFR